MAKEKKLTVIVGPGVARFPHVHKPDSDGKFADNKFKTTIVLDGDYDMSKIEAAATEAGARKNVKRVFPLIKSGDDSTNKDGDPIAELAGKTLITAKSKFAPDVVDAKRQPLAEGVEVRGGDVVKLILEPILSDMPKKNSVAWRLLAVQLVQKRASAGGWGGAFEDESGEESNEGAASGFGGEAPSAPGQDDELPF